MKKVVIIVLSLAAVLFLGFVVVGLFDYTKKAQNAGFGDTSDLIPVGQITGIDTKATLREGCFITSGYSFPINDNGPWEHCVRGAGIVSAIESEGSPSVEGLPAQDIRIIDVYGSKCTIVYTCSDDHKRYETEDFPLAYLKYNESKVNAANDGIKTTLYGSRFTLASGLSFSFPKLLAAVAVIFVFVMTVVFVCKRKEGKVT